MKPVTFSARNAVLAKDQPEYIDLPVFKDEREFISCWKLTLIERIHVLFTGRLWYRQMRVGDELYTPSSIEVRNPWGVWV